MAVAISQTANPAGVSASSNVATYNDVSIGTVAADRTVVVAVGTELASSTPSACTIDYGKGAIAMTAATGGNFGAVYSQLFYLAVPTGASAVIKVTYSSTNPSNVENHIAVYKVTGAKVSSSGSDGSTDMDATDPLTTGSITIPTDGGFIAIAAGATDTTGKTWANATEDIDADVGGFRFTTATRITALTTTAVTCTGGTNGEDGALSYIIFASNSSPTVSLSSPADAGSTSDTTPDLTFTGTDADSDDVRYQVQIATSDFSQVTFENLTAGVDTTDDSDSTTASITPSVNKLVVLSVESKTEVGGGTDPNQPTATGCNLTWVAIDSIVTDPTSLSRRRITQLRGMGSSPTTGAITIDFGGQTQITKAWSVDQMTNMDTSGTNGSGAIVQSVTMNQTDEEGTTTSPSLTLAAISNTNNAVFAMSGQGSGSVAVTAGQGFTLLGNATDSGENNIEVNTEYRSDNYTNVNFWWSPADSGGGIIAIEIKAAQQDLVLATSGTDAGFSGSPDNSDPFASGQAVTYTVQSALSDGTYYWRVRAKDPTGTNAYGAWSASRSFIVSSASTSVKDMLGMGFIPFAR